MALKLCLHFLAALALALLPVPFAASRVRTLPVAWGLAARGTCTKRQILHYTL